MNTFILNYATYLMNCYNHHTVSAVGICKNCNKGLCPECLTEIENGIACTTTCVEEVKTLNALINQNKNSVKRVAGTYYRTTFIYFGMGLLFLYASFLYPDAKYYLLPAGGLFLLMSLLNFNAATKYKKG